MIEQNVLLGNGINIEFSENDDYKNFAILQRMCVNLSTPGRYIDIFNGIIDSSDMYDFTISNLVLCLYCTKQRKGGIEKSEEISVPLVSFTAKIPA